MKSMPWVLGIGLLVVCLALVGCKPESKQVTIPDVVGKTQAAASTAVTVANLTVGAITEAYSATVAAGAVISQNPAAGASVSPGAVVALTVSRGSQPVTVPNVVGQTQAAASSAVTGAGLAVGTVTQAYSATVAVGTVVSQTPAAGTEVVPGTTVNFVVSLGSATVSVPNVAGQTQAAAQTALTGAGLAVGTVTEEYHATIPAGQVITHNPTAGASVSPATAVALTVSKGPQPPVAVPNVVGKTQAAASTAITGANLTVGSVTQAYSATVASGLVISQTPSAGASVDAGSAVALTVSKGPQPPVAVPNVVGKTQPAASITITGADLTVGAVTQAYSATVASGLVISQNPASGTSVSAGSAVALTVSKGPQPVTVPNVVGMTQAAATAAITGANLTLGAVKQVFSASVPSGAVMSQSPASGASVSPGSAVALTVSKGPQPPVTVPDVVGMTQSLATNTITGANLTLGAVTQEYSASVPSGTVISQSPQAGASVISHSTVALTVSKGPGVTVPVVVGLTQAAASAAVTGAGLSVGTITQEFSATVASGSVISSSPASGTLVDAGSAVALTVSKGPGVTVPNVVGMTQATATTTLIVAGLAVGTVTETYSATVAAGLVLSSSPAADAVVASGAVVTFTVSKGPAPVTLSNVVGLSLAAASEIITGAGLTLGTVTEEYSATVAAGLVISQTPSAGASVNLGSAVALLVSKGPAPVAVPNVVGLTQAAAGTSLTGANLTTGAITQEYSVTIAVGLVISQNPSSGTLIAPGSAVALVVSKGPAPVAVPNVVGLTQSAADAAVTGAGLTVGTITQEFSAVVASGSVISQTPAAGEFANVGTAVALTVSRGPSVTVSSVVGLTRAAATTALVASGLAVGTVTEGYSPTVTVGLVMSQNPAVGTLVSPGAVVALTVSKGPGVTVPNVVGLAQAAASTAVTGANLTMGTITQEFSATVASGSVISQTPASGEYVAPGSVVALTVSKGPLATVPNVVGMTQAAASATLTSQNLTVGAVTQECSATVVAGNVISQNPFAGASVAPGSTVDLLVSTGLCAGSEETVMLPGSVPLTMVWIPGGSFLMGRYSGEQESSASEDPQHSVTLGGFWMGKYELTKRQWTAVKGTTPWSGRAYVLADLDSPAVYVSWNDAQSFLTALNSQIGKTFKLPSEAEWEYAVRAGTTTRFYWGDDLGYTAIGNYAWYDDNARYAGQQYAHVVGGKLPNAFGLYDMSGNAWEWCEDDSHDNYTGAPTGGQAWVDSSRGSYRVLRGGSWGGSGDRCRSASRYDGTPGSTYDFFGFRVARTQ